MTNPRPGILRSEADIDNERCARNAQSRQHAGQDHVNPNKGVRTSDQLPVDVAPAQAATDDAEAVTVLAYLRNCADHWDGSARLIGDARARDISRVCTIAIKALTPTPPPPVEGRREERALLLYLANRIEEIEPSWLPISGHVRNVTFTLNEADAIITTLRSAALTPSKDSELGGSRSGEVVAWQWFWKSRGKWCDLKDPDPKDIQELRDNGTPIRALYAHPSAEMEALEPLKEQLVELFNFINEPPQYEDQRMVRDYRHELARKFLPFFDKLNAALSQQSSTEPRSAGRCDNSLANAIKVIKAEECPFKDGPMADGWAEAWATFLNRLGDEDGTNELFANSAPNIPGLSADEHLKMILAFARSISESNFKDIALHIRRQAEDALRSCPVVNDKPGGPMSVDDLLFAFRHWNFEAGGPWNSHDRALRCMTRAVEIIESLQKSGQNLVDEIARSGTHERWKQLANALHACRIPAECSEAGK
ncbi:hypothetical protein JQ628_11540 [Bradyrhizobium lablabi]|uniref:hypothetical protein n=1 Tax=Bradyrhizobium lablabi TaxID=722472 RepID=UPI001BAA02AC|nr:hypothetical protein [Bradyrhizobium lablabi]MBR1122149.1 hypothetical protein [Bradyrhizobium lablabi]